MNRSLFNRLTAVTVAAWITMVAIPASATISVLPQAGRLLDSETGFVWDKQESFSDGLAQGFRLATAAEVNDLFGQFPLMQSIEDHAFPAPAIHALGVEEERHGGSYTYVTLGAVGTNAAGVDLDAPGPGMLLAGYYSEEYVNTFSGPGGRTDEFWERRVSLISTRADFAASLGDNPDGSRTVQWRLLDGTPLWDPALETLGPDLSHASYYMVREVPEPTTLVLLCAGVLGLALTAGSACPAIRRLTPARRAWLSKPGGGRKRA